MIDLHIHSKYSDDGEFTPSCLIEKCKESNISMFSIADHNCIRANKEAQVLAKQAGISYVPGIEIDCTFQNLNFHVLGYHIDFSSKDFSDIEENIESQSQHASLRMLKKTQELGFSLSEEEMRHAAKENYWPNRWNGELFAEVLLKKKQYTKHPLLLPYRTGGLRSDNPYVNFYWDFYSQGKPCHAEISYPSMEKIIEIIHRNHGIAVLAHPGANLKGHEDLLPGIFSLGMDGIEAFSSYHTKEQSTFFYQQAMAFKKGVTCGSDYHGKTKPSIRLGDIAFPAPLSRKKIENDICFFLA